MPMFKNDNAISKLRVPHHDEGFFFHNLCSWALSLITTDRNKLEKPTQHLSLQS